MSVAAIIVAGAVAIVIAGFAVLGHLSRSGSAPGLHDSLLTACPKRPNCVSSENPEDKKRFVEPVLFPGDDPARLHAALRQIIEDMGGRIVSENDNYLAAEFRSLVFGFIDDFEIRIDGENHLLHLRSASRVGYSDRGVNRNRVEKFRDRWLENQAGAD